VSLVAVTLCTMMVIVVISVMGGWLRMFEKSFRGLTGDIIIDGNSMQGFAHYDEMIAEIEKLDGVAAALPVIEAYGLINIDNRKTSGVQVMGFDLSRIGYVNDFPKSLWRGYNQYLEPLNNPKLSDAERQKVIADAEQYAKKPTWDKPLPPDAYRDLIGWKEGKSRGRDPSTWAPMIAGAGILEIRKNEKGETVGRSDFLYELPVKLTVLGVSADFASPDLGNKAERSYWIVDDSRTQVWQYDNNFVYVPFDQLQADLGMTPQKYTDKQTGQESETPARTSEIHVKVKPGRDLNAVRDQIEPIVSRVLGAHRPAGRTIFSEPTVQTWREAQRLYLDAIEKEKQLMVFLFGIISVVAVFLIFCIFYMIVAEKTRDIGIIKSVGATDAGVAGIFLGYGLVIGIVGAGMGLLGSWLIVRYINEIHTWLGARLGVQVWNPEVYLFDKIPNTMDPTEVTRIVAIAVLASVLGALVPAFRASQMNPVEALRWE
jgi:lipoprotein-releasing system permease protein